MATKRLLEELTARFESTSPLRIALESTGGVDAAKRVRAGEAFDVVVLAGDVIDALTAERHIVEGSRTDIVKSPVAIAVRAGATRPDVGSAEAVKRAVLEADRIGYSTGPSGTYLGTLFAKWGIADALKERIVVAPPGVPVASLVAKGEVSLGFQQLSELIAAEGIDVIGMLPSEIQYVTTFSGGIAEASTRRDDARRVLEFFGSAANADLKKSHGMEQP
jgi:molybdate transport system substrate-binding protein